MIRWMHGLDGWMAGWLDGFGHIDGMIKWMNWMDGWMGWIEGWMNEFYLI